MSKTVILLNAGTDNMAMKNSLRRSIQYPPFGLLALEALLKAHGYMVRIIDLFSERMSSEEFLSILHDMPEQPLLAGISCYTENFFLCERIIQLLRSVYPAMPILIGGPHVSFVPDEALDIGANYVAMYEGERSIIYLLEYLLHPSSMCLRQVPGIAYREAGQVVCSERSKAIACLDHLPVISARFVRGDRRKTLYCITSRGCPGKCIFCASSAFSGRVFRMHSAAWVVGLIVQFVQRGGKHVSFIDDTFTLNIRRLKKIFRMLETLGISITWDARCRIDQLHPEFIRYLARYGCTSIHLGVESADQNVLNEIDKHVSLEQFYRAVPELIRLGIRPRCSFIIGHHCDTIQTIEKTLLLAYSLEISGKVDVAIGISTPFPGTPLYLQAENLGLSIKTRRWKSYTLTKPIYETENFSEDDLRRAYYIFNQERERLGSGTIISDNNHASFREFLHHWVEEWTIREATAV